MLRSPLLPGAVLLVLLSACATTREPKTVLPVAAQEQLLRALPGFELEGRAAFDTGNASIDWEQVGEQGSVRLSGTLGLGSLRVSWSPARLTLTDSRGQVFEDAQAEAVMREQIGFVPPFASLRHWMLGLEAPAEPATARVEPGTGRTGGFTQQQWTIRYDRWMNVAARGGGVELPRRVTITRDELRLRVFVDQWQLASR